MNIPDEKKVEILISNLEERYKAIHTIRDRVQAYGIWVLGLLLAATGWLVQSEKALSNADKVLYIFAIIVSMIVFKFYLSDLQTGFNSQQRTMVTLEEALKLYEKDFFIPNKSIFPEKWKEAGTKKSDGAFFGTTYALLLTGAIILVLAIVVHGC